MLLQPRKFLHKNRFKRRTIYKPFRQGFLKYGQTGLQLLQPMRLHSKDISKYKLLLKKACKRSDMTLRKFWICAFPHLPLSRKIVGSRMGKGKGKFDGWCSSVSAGVVFIEFKNLRPGRSNYFLTQIQYRLPVLSKKIRFYNSYIPIPLSYLKSVPYFVFW